MVTSPLGNVANDTILLRSWACELCYVWPVLLAVNGTTS